MKKIASFISAATSYLLFPASAFAIDLCPTSGSAFTPLCAITTGKFGNIISAAVTILFIIAVVVALFFLIWGGIKWVISGGDKTAVEGARNTIVAAVVGLVIVFLAYFILFFVTRIFLGTDFTNFELPTI